MAATNTTARPASAADACLCIEITSCLLSVVDCAYQDLRLPGERLLAPLSVHQLFDELHALEVHQLRVLLDTTIERHAHLPRAREDLGIVDGRFVHHHIRARARVTLHHVQLLAVEVARASEPGL